MKTKPEATVGAKKWWTSKSSLLASGGTIAVLAAVILVVAAFSAPKAESPTGGPSTKLSNEAASRRLSQQAEAALESGETTIAAKLAARAVTLDSANTAAKSVVDRAKNSSKKSSSSTSSGGATSGSSSTGGSTPSGGSTPGTGENDDPTTPPSDDGKFDEKLNDVPKLLPTAFDGYSLGGVVDFEGSVTIGATPEQDSAQAKRIVWNIHDASDAASALEFPEQVSKTSYANDAATFTVAGAPAYFGTDGANYATVVYTRGRYVFEVLLVGNGITPDKLRPLAEKAADSFAD